MKYTAEYKLECVNKYKNGIRINSPAGVSKHTFINEVSLWGKIYDRYGLDGLTHSPYDKPWTAEGRFSLVSKVMTGRPIRSVAMEARINAGQLYQWVRKYRERGMEGLQCIHKGRAPKEPSMPKRTKKTRLAPSEREELQLLRARNEYLETENAYLKKLDALATKREKAHPKAIKQKPSKNS